MDQPLISVLVPFKNTATFLIECIQSIIEQSYGNWELIAVNDHSADTSLDIMKDFAKKDNRIKVYTNTGNGIIEALRFAFSKSSGELISRMDSDDIMDKDKLKSMHASLLKNGKGHIALGLVRYFSEQGIGDGYARYEKWLNRLTLNGNNFNEIYKECVIPSPCWMVYRDDLIKCGAFMPNRYPEDYDLAFRFYENGLKCIPTDKLLHYWRDYDNRTSRTDEHYAMNHFLDIKLHYFLKLDFDNSRPLTLWGAGNKGKTIAKNLIKKKVPFYWICDNPKKIGKDIYGQTMREFRFLGSLKNPQSIVTVANATAQQQIKRYMTQQQLEPMRDYFMFC